MKNVAGFHSLDSHLFDSFLFSFRSGFGTRDLQNETSAIVAGAVPECRMVLEWNATARTADGDGLARAAAVRMAIRCSDILNNNLGASVTVIDVFDRICDNSDLLQNPWA